MIVALPGLFSYLLLDFLMKHLFVHYLFLNSSSFGASGGLCFVIVAFTGYLHLYFSFII